MEEDVMKLHVLTIAALGLLMLVTGLVLYFFRDAISSNMRFFLPIPPIGVASYIFVINLFRDLRWGPPGRCFRDAKGSCLWHPYRNGRVLRLRRTQCLCNGCSQADVLRPG